jgi:DNA-directed RNA polymerase beta subunit
MNKVLFLIRELGQEFPEECDNEGNFRIAIMPWSGYNQEDAIVFKPQAVKRGLFKT